MVTHDRESCPQRPCKLGGAKALPHSLALKNQGPHCLQGGSGCRVRATLESTTLLGYGYLPKSVRRPSVKEEMGHGPGQCVGS